MARSLRLQLRDYGCELTPAEFRELLADLMVEMFPALTDEDLIYTINESEEFCRVVRGRAECPDFSRDFILRSLVNVRKHASRS